MAVNAQQQIRVADLDVSQLADVRRQLDEVLPVSRRRSPFSQLIKTTGVDASLQLVQSVEAGSGKVQVLYRQRG
jgi:hypothetical protein